MYHMSPADCARPHPLTYLATGVHIPLVVVPCPGQLCLHEEIPVTLETSYFWLLKLNLSIFLNQVE